MSDDHQAIQQAIDAAGAQGGGTILLSGPATYLTRSVVTIKSHVQLVGESDATIQRAADSDDAQRVLATPPGQGVEQIVIKHLTLDCHKTSDLPVVNVCVGSSSSRRNACTSDRDCATGSTCRPRWAGCVELEGLADSTIDHVQVKNAPLDGLNIGGDKNPRVGPSRNTVVTDVMTTNNNRRSISITSYQHLTLRNLTVEISSEDTDPAHSEVGIALEPNPVPEEFANSGLQGRDWDVTCASHIQRAVAVQLGQGRNDYHDVELRHITTHNCPGGLFLGKVDGLTVDDAHLNVLPTTPLFVGPTPSVPRSLGVLSIMGVHHGHLNHLTIESRGGRNTVLPGVAIYSSGVGVDSPWNHAEDVTIEDLTVKDLG